MIKITPWRIGLWLVIFGCVSLFMPNRVEASARIILSGIGEAVEDEMYTVDVAVYSDEPITALQTILTFDSNYFDKDQISIVGGRCNFWAPANPSLGYGNNPTPYFHPTSASNKAVLACGFTAPGYESTDADGDLIAKIRLTPKVNGATSVNIDASNTLFRYIANSVSVGSLIAHGVSIYTADGTPGPSTTPSPGITPTPAPSSSPGASATPGPSSTPGVTPSPEPTVTPGASVNPSPASSASPGSTSFPGGDPQSISSDDLNFVEIGVNNQVQQGAGDEDVILEIVDEDNSIPDAPDQTPRPPATPFSLGQLLAAGGGALGEAGEVLAAQSLRELLVPGKSKADKTVVLVNLISTLTFLALLSIMIWRLVTVTRSNQIRNRHMKDLLTAELSSLQSKLGTMADSPQNQQIKQEIDAAIDKLTGSKKGSAK